MNKVNKRMEEHQEQAVSLVLVAVDSAISNARLVYAGGSRPTAGARNIHIAWGEQFENDGARRFAILVLELCEGESGETFRFSRVSRGLAQDRRMCRNRLGPSTRLKPG
jgi:hypothetical protein